MAGGQVPDPSMPGSGPKGTSRPVEEPLFDQPAGPDPFEGRIPGARSGLRRHTARGTIINGAFRVGISGLAFLQRIVVAIFLTPAELGTWGVVLITLLTLLFIKNIGISDKFVQQSESDQEEEFQKAFTFEFLLTIAFVVLAVAALPAFALAYDRSDIILPGMVLSLVAIGNSLQAPTWIFYRQMNFVRQRTLEAVDPGLTFVVTISLAAAGFGYWSLVVGAVVGAWSGGLIAVAASPYRLRLRPDRRTAREYFGFSWPLVVARISGIVIGQASILIAAHAVGIEGVGAITLAVTVIAFSDGVDAVVTQTIYPAICAVRNRLDLFLESFVKSNRLALMWGMPFGFGLALFASDLVDFVIGDKWRSAVFLLQIFGVIAALDQLGFNWTAFFRARNETRPLAVVGLVTVGAFFAIAAPLLILDGLHGYAIGMLAVTVVTIIARTYYLARLFGEFKMLWHAARSIAPVIPAVLLVLALRLAESGSRTFGLALIELAIYVAAVIVATLVFERALVREVLGYLRRPRGAGSDGDAAPGEGPPFGVGQTGEAGP